MPPRFCVKMSKMAQKSYNSVNNLEKNGVLVYSKGRPIRARTGRLGLP